MANITDYLEWRGDITFKMSPFNEVDNLIMSQIAYVNFDGIIPDISDHGYITLEKAADRFFEANNEKTLKESKSFIRNAPFLMRAAAGTERFKNIKLGRYKFVYDQMKQTQFAAFTADLGDGSIYVAYMGTDDTLIGWKEDFNMSFLQPVPAQTAAVDYLNEVGKYTRKKIRTGGHSKGGNLAVYSAVYAKNGVRKKIIKIYNNDGPGFDKSVITCDAYMSMKPFMISIVPYHSIVGMLLEHDDDYIVVSSSEKGIMQHDAMSWRVKGTGFVEKEDVSYASKTLNETLSNWINSISQEEREEFVTALFDIITASGATTLSEIQADRFMSAGASLKMYAVMPRQQKQMMRRILLSLTEEFDRTVKKRR